MAIREAGYIVCDSNYSRIIGTGTTSEDAWEDSEMERARNPEICGAFDYFVFLATAELIRLARRTADGKLMWRKIGDIHCTVQEYYAYFDELIEIENHY